MKRKLFKFALLCASVFMLPIGAWADTEIVNVNYAKLATDNFAKQTTVNVTLSSTLSGKINGYNVYPFSYSTSSEPPVTIISEGAVVCNRAVYFRFNNNSTIGLYYGNATQYGIVDAQIGDIIEVATNNGTSGTGVAPASCVKAALDEGTGTQTYTHSFNDGGTQRTLNYKIYTMTVSEAGLAGFELTGAYVAYIKVTRPSNTACTVNTSSYIAAGNNPTTPASFATTSPFDQSGTWTNSGAFSFEISGGNVRNYNNNSYKIQDQLAILIQYNRTYTITKSPNIKKVTLYIKQSDDNGGGTVYADYGEDSQTTLINEAMKKRSEDADDIDITSYSNIRVSKAAILVFEIEYYTSATLTVADINWASMYLPFAVNIPDGVTGVYYATSANSSTGVVTLTERKNDLPANTGVVVNAPEGTYTFTASKTTPDALSLSNLFSGVVTNTSMTDEENYVLAGSTNTKATPVFKLYSSGSGSIDLSAYKAYLPALNISSNARTIRFVIGNDLTDINSVSVNKKSIADGVYYNLAGQRVANPSKGLYIVNGKKVIIK